MSKVTFKWSLKMHNKHSWKSCFKIQFLAVNFDLPIKYWGFYSCLGNILTHFLGEKMSFLMFTLLHTIQFRGVQFLLHHQLTTRIRFAWLKNSVGSFGWRIIQRVEVSWLRWKICEVTTRVDQIVVRVVNQCHIKLGKKGKSGNFFILVY